MRWPNLIPNRSTFVKSSHCPLTPSPVWDWWQHSDGTQMRERMKLGTADNRKKSTTKPLSLRDFLSIVHDIKPEKCNTISLLRCAVNRRKSLKRQNCRALFVRREDGGRSCHQRITFAPFVDHICTTHSELRDALNSQMSTNYPKPWLASLCSF